MDEKPWQWMVDELTDDLNFWRKEGLDKKNPLGFSKLQKTLEMKK